jgi:hypothetical protein
MSTASAATRWASATVTSGLPANPPCAFYQHADTETEVLSTRNVEHLALARLQSFESITIDANVGVCRAKFLRRGKRGIRDRVAVRYQRKLVSIARAP